MAIDTTVIQGKNYAADEAFRFVAEAQFGHLFNEIRNNRFRLEERWKRYYRIWNCELDKNTYSGRSKLYVAALRQASETYIAGIVRDLFPGDDWFNVKAKIEVGIEQNAENLRALFRHLYMNQQNIKSDSVPAWRQLVVYGSSPSKLIWVDNEREVKGKERKQDAEGNWIAKTVTKNVKTFYGPKNVHIDLFNWYGWPETSPSVKECKIRFEDMELPRSHLDEKSKKWINERDHSLGHYYEVDMDMIEALGGANDKLWQARRERLQKLGIDQDPADRWKRLTKENSRYCTTETFATWDFGDGSGEREWLLTFVNDVCLVRAVTNPYWDGDSHFLLPRFHRVINELYGRGMFEVSDRVQYMINDIVNQTMDSIQYELNPITLINPSLVSFASSIKTAPGARWLVDPQGVEFTKPASVAAMGFAAFQQLLGIVHDTTASAAQQGIPATRGRGRSQNTASGMQQSLTQSSAPMELIIEDLEAQYCVPLLEKGYRLLEQFMDDPFLLRVLGRRGAQYIESRKVDIQDILGDYQFEWLGSITNRNKMVLGQQMINFANVARGFPPQVVMAMNWKFIAESIWSDAMQLKDKDQLFGQGGPVFSISPQLELELLQENREIKISPADDHLMHLKQHLLDYSKLDDEKDEKVKKELGKHIDETMKTIQMLVQQQQQQAMMQQIMQAQAAQQGQNGKEKKGNSMTNAPRPQNQPQGFQDGALAAFAQQLQPGNGMMQ